MRRWAWISAGVAVLAGAATAAVMAERPVPRTGGSTPPATGAPTDSGPKGRIDWVAASSGATPEFTQVSLEQDIALAMSVLRGPGRVLFAAGAGRPVVQVLTAPAEPDPVRGPLRDLFSPRGGRDATYRAPEIAVDGPATSASVLQTLRHALSQRGDPLLVLFGGHGYPGQAPIDNNVGLWGSSSVSAGELAGLLDEHPRPTRLVVTTCYSGGFAEIVFRDGAADMGAAPHPHCGLFAAPWDLEASGCDPDPNRARQEGYALHFFNALAGRNRDGQPIALAELDLDRDGEISLLEAHTRVRVSSSAPDVPTTTSERWLRHALVGARAESAEGSPTVALPEEEAVVRVLGGRLGVVGREREASTLLAELEAQLTSLDDDLARAHNAEDEAFRRASAEILSLWPVLDDPWHPGFDATLREHDGALRRHFADSESYAGYLAARTEVDRLAQSMADLRAEAAPLERLARAVETLALARQLSARGGSAWERYEALLACERWVPPVARD